MNFRLDVRGGLRSRCTFIYGQLATPISQVVVTAFAIFNNVANGLKKLGDLNMKTGGWAGDQDKNWSLSVRPRELT